MGGKEGEKIVHENERQTESEIEEKKAGEKEVGRKVGREKNDENGWNCVSE